MTTYPGSEFKNVFEAFRTGRSLSDLQASTRPLDLTGLLVPLLATGSPVVIYFPTGYYLTRESIEFHEGTEVVFAQGAVLMVVVGVSITFRGTLVSGLARIFGGYSAAISGRLVALSPGAIRFLGDKIREVPVEWFGAKPDLQEDSAPAINAAINAAHRDRVDGGIWLPPLPVVLSSRYFIRDALIVGREEAGAQPGPFILRGKRGIGGTPSLQPLGMMYEPMLRIRGEIAFLLEEIGFFSYGFFAPQCVEVIVSSALDASTTTARLPRSVSTIRRCTFTNARDVAVSITTPMSTAAHHATAASDPMPRVVFESCYFDLGDSTNPDRRALVVRAPPQVGVTLVGCIGGSGAVGHGAHALIVAHGGSLYLHTCTFHHDYAPAMTPAEGHSTDVVLESLTSPEPAVPAFMTMIQCHSQSRHLLQRRALVGSAPGVGSVVLVNSSCTMGNATNNMERVGAVYWQSNDGVDLSLMASVFGGEVRLSGAGGRVLDIFTNFINDRSERRGFVSSGTGPTVHHILR